MLKTKTKIFLIKCYERHLYNLHKMFFELLKYKPTFSFFLMN